MSVMDAAAWLIHSAQKLTLSCCCAMTFIGRKWIEFRLAVLAFAACMVWLCHTLHISCALWQILIHDSDFIIPYSLELKIPPTRHITVGNHSAVWSAA